MNIGILRASAKLKSPVQDFTANVNNACDPKITNRFVSDWNEVPVLRSRGKVKQET